MMRSCFSIAGLGEPVRRRLRVPDPARGGFVLLEVLVAMVILGISVATLMRSFTISMAAISKNDVTTQGCVLAESLLEGLEAKPPDAGTITGDFSDDGYPYYSYELHVYDQDIKYKDLPGNEKVDNLRSLKIVNLKITYDNEHTKAVVPVDVSLILPPIERFSYQSKFLNELFLDDANQ